MIVYEKGKPVMQSINKLTLYDIKNSFVIMFQNIEIKTILSLLGSGFSWLVGVHQEVIITVFVLMVFDTILGLLRSIKNNSVESGGFFKFASKFIAYCFVIISAIMIEKVLNVNWIANIIFTYLAATEFISIIENASILGVPIPKNLVKKLRVAYIPAQDIKSVERRSVKNPKSRKDD